MELRSGSGELSRKGMAKRLKMQRRIALRVACAYRTASTHALQVVASTPHLELQVEVRKQNHELCRDQDTNLSPSTVDNMLRSWQERWNLSSKSRWTHRLIPDIRTWYKRKHGHIDFWNMQALTGHWCFASYLYKLKKSKPQNAGSAVIQKTPQSTRYLSATHRRPTTGGLRYYWTRGLPQTTWSCTCLSPSRNGTGYPTLCIT